MQKRGVQSDWLVWRDDGHDLGCPVGIGPVISGQMNRTPVYYYDVAYPEGKTKRIAWIKTKKGGDRLTKAAAIYARHRLTEKLRSGGVTLVHDVASFENMVALLSARPQSAGRHAAG